MTCNASRSRGAVWTAVAVLLGGMTTGCTPARVAAPAVPAVSAACIVDSPASVALSVAVAQPVDPAHAPAPRNHAERLVFRQLYETLVRTDCEGVIRPALAESWSADETGRHWQFRLRPDARFADGSPVTPAAVTDSWAADAASAARALAGIVGITDAGAGELRVTLTEPMGAHVFADAGLAIGRPAAGRTWPVGTTAYRVEPAVDRDVTRLVADTAAAAGPRVLEFHRQPDPRAALDAGIDVVITSDPAALAYGRALADYSTAALPWDRTYVLVTPGRGAVGATAGPPVAALDGLAVTALPGDARPADPPGWWRDPACALPPQPVPARTGADPVVRAGAIVHARDDAAARAITERLVALAWPATSAPAWLRELLPADYATGRGLPTALALEPHALHIALHAALEGPARSEGALAFVVAVPRTPSAACAPPAGAGAAALHALLSGPADWRVTPLVDARDRLVLRGGAGRVLVDGDGALIFTARAP